MWYNNDLRRRTTTTFSADSNQKGGKIELLGFEDYKKRKYCRTY